MKTPTRFLLATLGLPLLLTLNARAQIVIMRTFVINTTVPDGGELASAPVLDLGSGTIQNVQVGLNLSNAVSGGPMFNGDLYASLGHDTGFAVLLNRVGKTSSNAFGYSDTGFDVTFADGAGAGNIHTYQTTLGGAPSGGVVTGTWATDGRNVSPATVTNTTPVTATLASFNGLNATGEWRLLVSDESGGAVAQLTSWSLRLIVQPGALQAMSLDSTELFANSAPQTLANPLQLTGASTISGSFNVTLQGALTGSGTLTKINGGTLTLNNPQGFAGAVTVSGGTLALPAGFTGTGGGIALGAGAVLNGGGTIARALTNQGTVAGPAVGSGQFLTFSDFVTGAGNYTGRIAMTGSFSPGNSPAAVSVTGDLLLASTNRLTMEIASAVAGTGYDQLQISNALTFGGTLQVVLLNAFVPTTGASYQLFTAGSFTSAFDTLQLAGLPAGLQWDASLLTINGTLGVSAIPEPATLAWWLAGVALIAALRRRKTLRP